MFYSDAGGSLGSFSGKACCEVLVCMVAGNEMPVFHLY